VGYCRGFNDTRTVNGIAVMTTNSAQAVLRAGDTATATAAILKKAAKQEGHYVIFASLSGHGATETAHYRVAAITGMVNACTTVPSSLPPIPVSVPC
jgi:predicted alternative tryptophan synthase beta-subunit